MEMSQLKALDTCPEKAGVQLSSPWETYFKMVYNLFVNDPEVTVSDSIKETEDPGVYSFYLESPNATKIIALSKILKNEIQMGNITIKVEFRCTNNAAVNAISAEITPDDYRDAFTGNPLFVEVVSIKSVVGTFDYAVFVRDIISFFNDDMSDYHANAHYIVADIVREIVNGSNISPCTFYGEEEA